MGLRCGGAPYHPHDALVSRGRVIYGYPATRSRDDALALLRRDVDAGFLPQGRTLDALMEDNERCIDALVPLLTVSDVSLPDEKGAKR